MNRSRLGDAALDALVLSFVLGAVLAPPDPFAQLLYAAPAFVAVLPVVYRYGRQSVGPWWRRYLLFVGGVLAFGLAWRLAAFAVDIGSASGVRAAFTLAGVAFGAWLAYFGGLERLRGEAELDASGEKGSKA